MNIGPDNDDLVFRVTKARRPVTVPLNPEPDEVGYAVLAKNNVVVGIASHGVKFRRGRK